MRYKRDTRKKRFIAALTTQGTVFHACKAAGISRQTVYRWQREDPEFAEQWYEAHENAVDAVESTIYQQAIGGNTPRSDLLSEGPPSDLSRQSEHRHRTSEG